MYIMLIKSLIENICYLRWDGYRLITCLWFWNVAKIKIHIIWKRYFYTIKITLFSIKYIFITSLFFIISKYFYSVKVSLYPIRYIFIIQFFSHDIKIYFYSIKINLYSIRNIPLVYIFFIQVKHIFSYRSFSFNTFQVSISGLPFVFPKFRILFSVCKLNCSTMMWESC